MEAAGGPRRVLVVEDSSITRRVLKDILEADGRLKVVHQAADGIEALAWLKTGRADVVTLDVHMPNLGGVETLRDVIRLHRLPCVMVSSATRAEAAVTLEALDAGAVDFFAKPDAENPAAMMELGAILREKVVVAAACDVESLVRERPELGAHSFQGTARRDLILLGASTGGPRTLQGILAAIPGDVPARIVICQHMPAGGFTGELAAWLDRSSRLTVREARDRDELEPGLVLVAPGGRDLELVPGGTGGQVRLESPEKGALHRPSVDRLFGSAVVLDPRRTIACLLTGMGRDGARGMGELREAGAATLAESERSSVVFGMPRAAIEAGVVETVVSKEQMAEEILHRMLV